MLGAIETLDPVDTPGVVNAAGAAVRPASFVATGADETASAPALCSSRSPVSRPAARACVLRDSVPDGFAGLTAAPAARACCASARGALGVAADCAA
ncbi:hypothetical protein [Paraburkholderia acidisoli]|uniref:Uncharacterized protein n=1 Tax=Paraburkholderia acidisoli TaxID=2571748 RepID=A0A7Z2JFU1_9BURK|nr:hypothetical protein [Paraburkholderia acidisoli]QGZ62258.1 hypothetical protein FAZ98_11245 [Paraburkholderia acidisoli]